MPLLIQGTFEEDGSSEVTMCTDNFESNDGMYIKIWGDFGGGVVFIEEDHDGGVFVAKQCSRIYSDTEKVVLMPNGTRFRITLEGSTSPDLNYYIANMSYRGDYI